MDDYIGPVSNLHIPTQCAMRNAQCVRTICLPIPRRVLLTLDGRILSLACGLRDTFDRPFADPNIPLSHQTSLKALS